MERNFITNLKEKKKVMKLSIVALVGAVAVCGGAALCSVSAMKPCVDDGTTTASITSTEGLDTKLPSEEQEEAIRKFLKPKLLSEETKEVERLRYELFDMQGKIFQLIEERQNILCDIERLAKEREGLKQNMTKTHEVTETHAEIEKIDDEIIELCKDIKTINEKILKEYDLCKLDSLKKEVKEKTQTINSFVDCREKLESTYEIEQDHPWKPIKEIGDQIVTLWKKREKICASLADLVKQSNILCQQLKEKEAKLNQSDQKVSTFFNQVEWGRTVLRGAPTKENPNFERFLDLPDTSKLSETREYKVSPAETEVINEKEVYKEIENTVKGLIEKVERRTPPEGMSEDEIKSKITSRELSKHYQKSKQMRIAKAIYHWCANNIKYDNSYAISVFSDREREITTQSAIFVFHKKLGVCEGISQLMTLMMRIAGIPCGYVGSDMHAFNVIYNDEIGWTFVDATAGGNYVKLRGFSDEMYNEILKKNFPDFYAGDSLEAIDSFLEDEEHLVKTIIYAPPILYHHEVV